MSILRQTLIDFEFIILDDGSTDKSWNIIFNFQLMDDRIKAFKQQNNGLTKSLNQGISLSSSSIVARQMQIDISHPRRLEQQYNAFTKGKLDFCVCRAFSEEKNKITPGISYFMPKKFLLLFYNPFIHGTFMLKKSLVNEIGKYNENIRYAQDYDLVCRMFKSSLRFNYLKNVLYTIGKNNNSISLNNRIQQNSIARKIKIITGSIVLGNSKSLF